MTSLPANKALLRVLRGDSLQPPPVWLMRQAGRYLPEYRALRSKASGFLDFCYTPELAVEATLQPIRRFGLDAAILFSDILVVADALGAGVAFREGEGPVLEPVTGPGDIDRLDSSRVAERLAPVYETVRAVRALLPPTTALIGFAGAPWTVAAYMVEGRTSRDFFEARRWALGNPESFRQLVDRLVEGTVAHLCAQLDAGADCLQLFESWAGALNPATRRLWSIEPIRRVIEGVRRKHPGALITVFPRGAGVETGLYARETGASAIGIDTTTPLTLPGLPKKTVLQGNLDPAILVVGGDLLDESVAAMIRDMQGRPYIVNLGHGVVPETPPEHVGRLVELVRRNGGG